MIDTIRNIPVVILAGGLGTRISEETNFTPKPMIEIGDSPILLHIMRWYYSFGFSNFIICGGYKSWQIKEYFLNYGVQQNHLEVDMRVDASPKISTFFPARQLEKWRVRVIDTGLTTMTGGRVGRALSLLADEEFSDFALTYGDGLSDVNLAAEYRFHKSKNKIGTMLGVSPPARFGEVKCGEDGLVTTFVEKPVNEGGRINGGFFFFNRRFTEYLSEDEGLVLENQPLVKLAADRNLALYRHSGFWQCMDTLRDKKYLQSLAASGDVPWQPLSDNISPWRAPAASQAV